jgi:hypothetical protein
MKIRRHTRPRFEPAHEKRLASFSRPSGLWKFEQTEHWIRHPDMADASPCAGGPHEIPHIFGTKDADVPDSRVFLKARSSSKLRAESAITTTAPATIMVSLMIKRHILRQLRLERLQIVGKRAGNCRRGAWKWSNMDGRHVVAKQAAEMGSRPSLPYPEAGHATGERTYVFHHLSKR